MLKLLWRSLFLYCRISFVNWMSDRLVNAFHFYLSNLYRVSHVIYVLNFLYCPFSFFSFFVWRDLKKKDNNIVVQKLADCDSFSKHKILIGSNWKECIWITTFMLLLVNNVVQKTRRLVTKTILLYRLTNFLLFIYFKLWNWWNFVNFILYFHSSKNISSI